MKITAYFVAFAIIVVVAIPYFILNTFSNTPESIPNVNTDNTIQQNIKKNTDDEKISVYLQEKGVTVEVPLEEYVACVVACEMPGNFQKEAMKAQAVTARTYGLAKQGELCNTVHCQVFKPESEIKAEKGEEWVEKYWGKIKSAAEETEGQVMYYDGELVQQAMFHSSSGGKTENSEDIFVTAVPYLRSVDSRYEEGATHENDQNIFNISHFAETINKIEGINHILEKDVRKMKITERSDGGSVEKVKIGENELTGKQIKEIFGVSSLNFTFKVDEENVIITSVGYGHGVGMSQYGANGMAKKGYDYSQILKHYYSGIQIKKIKS